MDAPVIRFGASLLPPAPPHQNPGAAIIRWMSGPTSKLAAMVDDVGSFADMDPAKGPHVTGSVQCAGRLVSDQEWARAMPVQP